MRKMLQLLISLALTVLVGYLLYREVPDWGQAFRVMVTGRYSLILAGLIFISLHMVLRAARWGVLLEPAKKDIPFRILLSLTLVKYVVNIIPPRAGEIAASALLAQKEKIPTATVIVASVLERILDTITVLGMFGLYLLLFSHRYTPDTGRGREIMLSVRSYSLKGFVAICVCGAILAVLLRGKHLVDRIPGRIGRVIHHSLEGFRALQSRWAAFKAVLLSAAIWLSITLQLWCLVQAYLRDFPFAGSLLLMAMTVVGVSIPTPGGVGGFQFFMNLTLVNFFADHLSARDPHSQAAGISNGAYLVSMGPVMIAGLILLNREGLSLGRISRMSEEEKANPSESGQANTTD